ncbi:MAG: hypothetical protein IJW38_02545 [Clostridia bacterium]|nr:hypothetical protein [Clostridia bacterium]
MCATTKRSLTVLLCSLLVLVFVLGSCTSYEDSQESKKLCEEFIDYTLANDRDSAYGMIRHIASDEEFDAVWEYIRGILKDSKSYTLKQIYWNKNLDNGVTTTTVIFEMTTDDEKMCRVQVITMPETKGPAGLHFTDITEFVEKTKVTENVNLILTLVSLLGLGFMIWMFVDCIKRSIKRKVLWAILIWVGFAVSVTLYAKSVGFDFRLAIPLSLSSMTANSASLSVTLTVAIPIGAIVYFFVRKKLPSPAPAANTDETASAGDVLPDQTEQKTAESESAPNENTETSSETSSETKDE